VVADEHAPGGERVETGECVHERRLAGARRAHDGGEVLVGEVDGHAVEGPHLRLAPAVHLHGVDGGGGGRSGGGGGRGRRGGGVVGAGAGPPSRAGRAGVAVLVLVMALIVR